ncbi:hypothetical protein QNO00_14780 [Arthrobacter sp. zg-Y1219]|uniref:hypothetical protein n=1 Tax=Arthrobacter sp. zg-Y1219 TaxID=3049067 RepID=UPI0024C3F1B7|nr:hypothetical protein [Arthrobacter sp. zg-Y1219]MDK1361522.1 hypothetical protein [Arthrobacter sp. zg-Y1219]
MFVDECRILQLSVGVVGLRIGRVNPESLAGGLPRLIGGAAADDVQLEQCGNDVGVLLRCMRVLAGLSQVRFQRVSNFADGAHGVARRLGERLRQTGRHQRRIGCCREFDPRAQMGGCQVFRFLPLVAIFGGDQNKFVHRAVFGPRCNDGGLQRDAARAHRHQDVAHDDGAFPLSSGEKQKGRHPQSG